MLLGFKHILDSKKIFLASKSTARKQLLEQLGLKFETLSSDFEENLNKKDFLKPEDYCKATCLGKVSDIMKKVEKNEINYDLLIFCDTICFCSDKIIEKPENDEEALEILKLFSGKSHSVYTNIHLILKNNEKIYEENRTEHTEVIFDNIPIDSIVSYSKSDYYKNKAGGYAIQDIGASFIKEIHGCFSNVIGLPVNLFCRMLVDLIVKSGLNK